MHGKYVALGTDGYGRSDRREQRDFFEISTCHLVINALKLMNKDKEFKSFIKERKIDFSEVAPWKK